MVELLPLSLKDARVMRQGQRVLGPVSLNIPKGGVTAIIGPNGAGKTTLLRVLHGIEKLSGGRLSYNCPKEQAFALQSLVFQRPILMRRSVVQNVAYPLQLRGVSASEASQSATDWLSRMGLAEKAQLPALSLSGGERQKMALARAMVRQPKLLLLDEPTASLDGASTRVIEHTVDHARAQETTVVLASHDLAQVRRLADRVTFLWKGQVTEDGPAQHVLANPKTDPLKAFLNGDILE